MEQSYAEANAKKKTTGSVIALKIILIILVILVFPVFKYIIFLIT